MNAVYYFYSYYILQQYLDEDAMEEEDSDGDDVDINQVYGVISCVNLTQNRVRMQINKHLRLNSLHYSLA